VGGKKREEGGWGWGRGGMGNRKAGTRGGWRAMRCGVKWEGRGGVIVGREVGGGRNRKERIRSKGEVGKRERKKNEGWGRGREAVRGDCKGGSGEKWGGGRGGR